MRYNNGGNLSDNPIVVLLGIISSLLAIFVFITGYDNLSRLFPSPGKGNSTPTSTQSPGITPTNTPVPPTPLPIIPPTYTPIPPTPDQVGYLMWELRDNSSKKVLDEGKSIVLKNDVYTDTGTLEIGATYYEQSIALNPNFAIGIRLVPQIYRSDIVGFGMVLKRRDIETFSWDWFDIQDTKIANKLQEGGQLEYEIGVVKSKWDITYLNFLSDVILRCYIPAEAEIGNPPNWTVTIFKGSYIKWPPP
jgi:hypothetical protein